MDDPFSRPGPERSFPCPRSAVCIIVTNASRPDHPALGFDQFLSVATWTLLASRMPLHRFAGTIRRNKHRDDRAHGRLQNPLAQNDVRAGEPSRRWEARWNKWKGQSMETCFGVPARVSVKAANRYCQWPRPDHRL